MNSFYLPVNDSLATNLCLLWEPEVIAIALLYMSFKMARMADDEGDQAKMGTDHDWWDKVGYFAFDWMISKFSLLQYVQNLTVQMMEEICHKASLLKILKIYILF